MMWHIASLELWVLAPVYDVTETSYLTNDFATSKKYECDWLASDSIMSETGANLRHYQLCISILLSATETCNYHAYRQSFDVSG